MTELRAKTKPKTRLWLSLVLGLALALSCSRRQERSQDEVRWQLDFATALNTAKERKRPVLLFATAPWCAPCERMKTQVMTHPRVERLLLSFELAYVNLDLPKNESMWERYGIKELPWIGFLDSSGSLIDEGLVAREERNVDQMVRTLEEALRFISHSPR